MFRDSASIQTDATVDCDVCVVGTGPAGLSLALQFMQGGLRVALLESGGFEFEPEVEMLSSASVSGTVHGAWAADRLRYFGGTSNHWGGSCIQYGPTVLGARDWLDLAAWPLDREDLEPWYRLAAEFLTIRANEVGGARSQPGTRLLRSHVAVPLHVRLGPHYRATVCEAPRIDLVLHATLTALHQVDGTVTHAEVAKADGRRFRVRARSFVLAAGLENARLLLLSESVLGAMPAASRDLVGRYLMGHVAQSGALIVNRKSPHADALLAPDGFFALDDATQRADRTIGGAIQLGLIPDDPRMRQMVAERTRARDAIRPALHTTSSYLEPDWGGVSGLFTAVLEQLPSHRNRVQLGSSRNRFGVRTMHVHMEQGPADVSAVVRCMRSFARELGRLGVARLQIISADAKGGGGPLKLLDPDSHYMGSTRMDADPAKGVVDADTKVHGLSNLFIAGSSVFPNGGWANPTWTIVALAVRLAAHIRSRLGDQ